ncbi:hypothetical protein YC2023_075541 [Brassica napus]
MDGDNTKMETHCNNPHEQIEFWSRKIPLDQFEVGSTIIKNKNRPGELFSTGLSLLLYTHSPESSHITVNCSCDTEQGYEETMMGSHPGGRVTACSVRSSILEYLMEMYSENLGSTIEEHQPCHFRSSTIGGVTPTISTMFPSLILFWIKVPRHSCSTLD